MAKWNVLVELFYNGQWNDHTNDVYTRDEIKITHGATDAYSSAQPSSCKLTLKSITGTFHPGNPNSPLFGLIGRNTPIRVSVDGHIRFAGEVASWTPRRAIKGDAWTHVVAHGISHRLGQGTSPLRSSLATEVPKQVDTGDLHEYWPCEDGAQATQLASGLPDRRSLSISGDVETAVSAPIFATEPLLRLNNGSLQGSVPGNVATKVVLFLDVPEAGLNNLGTIATLSMTGGGIDYAQLQYLTTGDGNLQITLVAEDGTTDVHDSTFTGLGLNGGLWIVSLSVTLVAPNPDDTFALGSVRSITTSGEIGDTINYGGAVISNEQPGRVTWVTLGGGLGPALLGHPAVTSSGSNQFPYDEQGTTTAFAGEHVADRIKRLGEQAGVPTWITGKASETSAVGPQAPSTLRDLLRESADVDSGILHDDIESSALRYRTGHSLYNQAAALTLDFANNEIAPPLQPVFDDLDLRNRITVRRRNGAQFITEDDASIDSVGRINASATLNLPGDGAFLENQAGWRLHLGIDDSTRFARVTIDLDASPTP